MKLYKTMGKLAPVNPGYLPLRSWNPLEESQRQALLEVVVALEETKEVAPNGLYCYVVQFNAVKEQFANLKRVCEEQGLELMLPPPTAEGVTFMPFKK